MTIVEPTRAETVAAQAPTDAQRAALAAGDRYVDLYLELSGPLDAERLRTAIDTAVAEFPQLHSTFDEHEGQLRVREHPAAVPSVEVTDPGQDIAEWIERERARPMDVARGPLHRQAVFRYPDGRLGWYQRYHRLVNDHPGALLVLARVRDLLGGTPGATTPVESRAERLENERRYRESGTWSADRDHWEHALAEAARPEPLATDLAEPADGAVWTTIESSAELTRIARACGGGAPAVLLAALAVYTSRTALAGECVIALDTGETAVPLRIPITAQVNFVTVAKQVGRELRKARRHRFIPDIDEPWADSPVHGQWPLAVRMLGGAAIETLGSASVTERFAHGDGFTVCVDDQAVGGWRIAVGGVHRSHRDRLIRLLGELARAPHTPLARIDLAAPEEIECLLGVPPADTVLPSTTLVDLLAEQAARSPAASALVGHGTRMTYAELHAAANRLARMLIELGVGPETLVALAFDSSFEQVVAVHAVLAAGGAYLALDLEHPRSRHALVVEIARPLLVLTTRRDGFDAPEGIRVIHLEDLDTAAASAAPVTDADRRAPLRPENLAYISFTSGSTGQPKGVAIVHATACVHLAWMQHLHGLDETDAVVRKTTLTFDLALWEVLWPLTVGARLVIEGLGPHGDPNELARVLAEHRVTTVQFTPSTLAAHRQAVPAPMAASVRRVLLCGEQITPALAAALPGIAPGAVFDNFYGPTEVTVVVTRHPVGADSPRRVPIGAPGWHVRTHVLDACLRPVAAGLPGELYLGGPMLGRGYAGQPGLTATRFVADPFGEPGRRLYRTGDLVRSTGHGELEYLGRTDFQVKLRGVRIELGELESVLAAQESVAQAVAVVHAGGGGRLIAYAAPAAGHRIDPGALEQRLRTLLPRHLVPAAIIALPALPMTRTGKVDRNALPAPDVETGVFRAPRSDAEIALAAAYSEVLGRDAVGVDDSFFALGGDSIMSILLVSRARAHGITVTAQQVFEHRTVARLAAVAETDGGQEIPMLAELPGGGTGDLPLTPIVRFLVERGGEFDRFCQSMTLHLPVGIDRGALVSTLTAVIDHHDMLRSRLGRDVEGDWCLQVAPPGSIDVDALIHQVRYAAELPAADLRTLAEAELNAAVDRIDPATGAVLRFVWLTPDSGTAPGLLVIAAHHIAVDGVSWRILLPDFIAAWAAVASGATPRLPAAATSMRRWAHALAEAAHSDALTAELPLWREIVEGPAPAFGDRAFDPRRDLAADIAHTSVELGADETAALLTLLPQRYRIGVADALLTALALAVTRWRSWRGETERSVLLRLEGHGREQDAVPGAELSRTVGWFTSLVPARLDLTGVDLDDAFDGGPAMALALKAVKEQVRVTPRHGFGYGLLRYLNADTAAALAPHEPGEISFNYFGHITGLDIPTELTGLGFLPSTEFGMPAIRPDARRGALGAVEVDSIVLGGRLVTGFGYVRGLFGTAAGEELVELWRSALDAVVRHARTPDTGGGHTPSDFPLATVAQRDIDGWEQRYPALTDVWPATPLQAGMMFHALFDPDAVDVYTIQLVVDLHDTVDTARLRSAADAALARHANLRTAFEVTAAGAPVQIVSAAAVLPWRELELPAATGADVRTLEAERLLPFDLTAPPLLRFLLLRLDDGRTRFAVTCHHLLLDGWSIPLLLREIMAEYAGLTIEPPPPYRRYLEWLARQDDSRSRPVWAETLAGITAPMLLADTVSVHAPTGVPRERAFDLDPAQTRALTRLAAEHEVTMNTVVQAAWAILLARTTDRDDVLFGTTVSGRPAELAGVENIVGLFINTIPVRVRLVPGESVGALLRRVQREQFALRAHHHLGLPDIIAQSGIGEPNLFDTLVVVETYPVDEAALRSDARAYAGLTIGDVRSAEATHYALTLTVRLTDRLHIMAGWWPELFDEQTVSRLGERLTRVLMELAANPNTVAAEIDPAGAVERDRMLEWQRPAAPTTEMTLVELFRTQAARQAEAVAVRYGDRTLTYRDLDERSDDLAHVLVASGARPESLVAVAVSRSTELIVALLAVLKSGGAYVPLDLGSPPQRLEFILGETKPACVLTTAADRAALPGDHYPVLILDDIGLTGKTELVAPVPDPDNLAYVLYTSGSTGRPKGVSVTHRNVVDLLAATRTLIDTDHADVWTMFHSPAFDVSVWEMWGSLLSGGTLVIVDAELTRSPQEFTELLVREGITVLCQTPSAFGALLDTGLRPAAVPALRHLVLAGEALQSRGLHGWFDADAGQARLWNLYGITEATVYSTHFAVDRAYADSARSSVIGRGLPGTTVRVLDSRLRPSPIGVRGEVYLTGTQLARGYHARPATSAERYVADPSGGPGERMLRTGDLARWTENGQLEYLGRGDQQVKIRGYRIEPGEVEAALLEHDSVTRAIVVARAAASGSTRLIAYVIPAGALEVEALETHLAQRLPAYLRPAAIMVVDTLPLTANGKLDVAALPDPVVSPRSDRAPHTTAEHLVADLFAEVLGIDRPGLDDSFFTLGGDSIISIQLSARARALGLRFTPREVFEHRTVAGIARVARTSDAGDGHGALPELPGGGVGELPLLPVARWLTERGGGFRRFTQTLTVELPADTSAHALITAVSAVIERHDMLRGRLFRDDSGSWRFDVAPALDASALVHATTFDDTADPDALRALVAAETDAALDRLDPAAGVMAQFVRLTAERGTVPDRLIIAVHHLAVDGVSWRILLPDLHAALAMDAKGAVPQLDPVATSMRRWAHGLLEAAHTPDRVAELEFWQRACATPDPLLGSRPLDPAVDTGAVLAVVEVGVDDVITETLLRRVTARFHIDVDEILIAALALALGVWRARQGVPARDTLLRLEGHGREEHVVAGADLSRTVGWFTSQYPVGLDLHGLDLHGALIGGDATGAVLTAVKEQLRATPDRGIGYGLLRYLNPATAQQLPAALPGQVAFNYLGRIEDPGTELLTTPGADPDPDLAAAAVIDVNAIVTGRRLRAGFAYPTTLLDSAAVSDLARLWVSALKAIAGHSWKAHAGGHTPSDFALVDVTRADITRWERDYGRLTDVWPLAPLQPGLLFHSMATTSDSGVAEAYNVQTVVRPGGAIDRDRLREAAERLLQRHAGLRAAFVFDRAGVPVQVVPESVELPWREVDCDTVDDLVALAAQERSRRFDPARPPLLRFTLARVAGAEPVLIVTHHHLLLDGWSVPLVLRELVALYADADSLPAPEASFRDYLAWNHNRDSATAVGAWRRALDGVRGPSLVAPVTRMRAGTVTIGDHRWSLDAETTGALRATAARIGVTLNTVTQVAWAILLGRRLGREDVVFGATVSGRPAALAGVESIVGLCINTVPVRVRFGARTVVAELLRTVQDEQTELMDHHQLGLTDIHAAAGLRDILFDTLLAFESYPVDPGALATAVAALDGLGDAALELSDATDYPLSVTVEPGHQLEVRIGYRRDVFDASQATGIGTALRDLLTAIARDPHATIQELP